MGTMVMMEMVPINSLLGGMLLGFAAVLFMATTGRIAGISGMLSRLLPPHESGSSGLTGAMFVLGLFGSMLVYLIFGENRPEVVISANVVSIVVSGLLVGLGTVIGNGCTSGHGVCGISRLSGRSITATLSFMISGMVTVYLVRHML